MLWGSVWAGVLVGWCAGVLVCWWAGVLVGWCSGWLVCWWAGVQVRKFGFDAYRYSTFNFQLADGHPCDSTFIGRGPYQNPSADPHKETIKRVNTPYDSFDESYGRKLNLDRGARSEQIDQAQLELHGRTHLLARLFEFGLKLSLSDHIALGDAFPFFLPDRK